MIIIIWIVEILVAAGQSTLFYGISSPGICVCSPGKIPLTIFPPDGSGFVIFGPRSFFRFNHRAKPILSQEKVTPKKSITSPVIRDKVIDFLLRSEKTG